MSYQPNALENLGTLIHKPRALGMSEAVRPFRIDPVHVDFPRSKLPFMATLALGMSLADHFGSPGRTSLGERILYYHGRSTPVVPELPLRHLDLETELPERWTAGLSIAAYDPTRKQHWAETLVRARSGIRAAMGSFADLAEALQTQTRKDLADIQTQVKMMNRKNNGLLGLMAMAAVGHLPSQIASRTAPPVQPRPIHDRPGMKPFIIDGQTVWALNEKNARRKAAKARG